jgi:hypothetical protein
MIHPPKNKLIEVGLLLPDSRTLATLAENEQRFFSNEGKKSRERWVLERWLAHSGKSHLHFTEGEAPDFTVGDESVEIVEVLERGRRRHADVKTDAVELRAGGLPSPRVAADLESVKNRGRDWILQQIDAKAQKYRTSAATWTLLLYVNVPWPGKTDWAAIRQELAAHLRPFRRIEALTADGQHVIPLFP